MTERGEGNYTNGCCPPEILEHNFGLALVKLPFLDSRHHRLHVEKLCRQYGFYSLTNAHDRSRLGHTPHCHKLVGMCKWPVPLCSGIIGEGVPWYNGVFPSPAGKTRHAVRRRIANVQRGRATLIAQRGVPSSTLHHFGLVSND